MTEADHESQSGFLWRLSITILLIAYGCLMLSANPEYFLGLQQQEGGHILLFPDCISHLYVNVRHEVEKYARDIIKYLLEADLSGISGVDKFYLKSISNIHALVGLLISRTIAAFIWLIILHPFGILMLYIGILERKIRHEDSDYASPFVQRTSLFFVRISFLAILLSLLTPIGLHAYCLPLMLLFLFMTTGFFIGSVQALSLKISR